jgi:tetratricopeptide (TPR) repeat protein
MIWRTRPLFVSSTFNDFQAERDLLQDLVFPDLAERLKARGHDLEPIDLRLGVETASEDDEFRKTLLVLNVCIQEAMRSRPFMIVLIGERYGAVVPPDRARRALEEAGVSGDPAGQSVTELEIEFGLQRVAAVEPVRAHAYFRTLDMASMSPEQRGRYRDADQTAVGRLKAKLRDLLGSERCHPYTGGWVAAADRIGGLDEFRAMVVEDLWRDLDEATRSFVTITETPQQRERTALESFLHESARDFVGREELLAQLGGVSRSESPPVAVCITGEPGSGKSSVAAEVIRRLREDDSILLLEHAAGISADSVRIDRLLTRWSHQLAEWLGEERPGEDLGGQELEQAFARLLSGASQRCRVVLVVDALNEFERTGRARRLSWLPRIWPANARLIATAIPGPESEWFAGRSGFELVELEPLTGAEAERILDSVYGRYRRRASPEVKRAILAKATGTGEPASANALWLELACEEMNLLDPADYRRAQTFEAPPDRQLVLMQLDLVAKLPSTARAMYGRMLERSGDVAAAILGEENAQAPSAETRGRSWAEHLALSVAISRDGWRDRDLQSVLPRLTGVPWTELLFASVRRSFRGHLTQRGAVGQWSFYHRELRLAAAEHFNPPADKLHRLHSGFVAHLETLPEDDPLRQTELMHHLIGANDRLGAARLYARSEHDSIELRAQTESLADLLRTREESGSWVAGLLREDDLSVEERVLLGEKLAYPLDDELAKTASTDLRRGLLQAVRGEGARLEVLPLPDPQRHLAARMQSVAMLRLADLTFDTGDAPEAKALYEAVLERSEAAAGEPGSMLAGHDLTVVLERLADIAAGEGDVERARQYLNRAVASSRRLIASSPNDPRVHGYLASALERLGLLALNEGDRPEAERGLRESAAEHDLATPGAEQSTNSMQILGHLAAATGEVLEAKRQYRLWEEALRARTQAAPEDVEAQIAWATSLERLGDVAMSQLERGQAEELFNQELVVAERLATQLPDDVATQRRLSVALEKLGDCALQSKQYERARPWFERSLAIRQRLHELLPSDLRTLRDLGLAHERLGMLEDGSVQDRVRHSEDAVATYNDLYERLPGNEEAGRTLALGHFALSQALASADGRQDEPLAHAARAHELLSDLRAAGRMLPPDAQRLLAFLDTQGGGSGRWTHPVPEADEQQYAELNALGLAGVQAVAAGDLQTARRYYAESLELALSIEHPPSIARAYGSLGDVEGKLANTRRAVELLEKAIDIARENDLPSEEGTALDRLAELYAVVGDHERSMATYSERVSVARRSGDQRALAIGSGNLGIAYYEAKRLQSALTNLHTAARLFEAHRMLPELAKAYSYIGACYIGVRDADRAISAYSKHIDVCREIGDSQSAALSMVNLSSLLDMTGAHDEAIAIGQEACQLMQRLGMPQAREVCARVATLRSARQG